MSSSIAKRIAVELNVREQQVNAAITLLNEGATVPFIARYRKEVTNGLDDTQLRALEERLAYLTELEDRRAAIIKSITEQEKLTPSLLTQLQQADTKQSLEDLYLPFKPKRRTKAQIAREQGLAPLADKILSQLHLEPAELAATFVGSHPDLADLKSVLDGARHIVIETWSEDASLIGKLRNLLWQKGQITTKRIDQSESAEKFKDYFAATEDIRSIPSHRALAILRGVAENALSIKLDLPESSEVNNAAEVMILQHARIDAHATQKWRVETAKLAWKGKIGPSLENELLATLKESSETEAIRVFAKNLKDLLLAAPAGQRVTIGLDPGLRTGVKVAVVDGTGKLLATDTIYPHVPRNDWSGSLKTLTQLVNTHQVELIAIGNGTASRETDKLAQELIKSFDSQVKLQKIVVSEAGASVYSASELAAKEFPTLDVSLRGAVSIARRLQDPLAELVKITPKSIGVGQYQHDVNQVQLAKSLDAVVEDCVNAVGVDLNTASISLLTRISGLSATIAKNIVEFRDQNGEFLNREQLKRVPRLGEKTFEQAAGFLRIRNSNNPLDNSSVHPESYPVVAKMLAKLNKPVLEVIGNSSLLKQIPATEFVDGETGLPTIMDILKELEKPGRDPRPEFKAVTFDDGVNEIKDLAIGMLLNGVVTNVTNFGAFVDIGVHQDGLVHISALSDQFVKDPHQVVKAGDIVKVKVTEIDVARKRIALSMKLNAEPVKQANKQTTNKPTASPKANVNQPKATAFSEAFAKLKR
ncbi:RNA-binding transcriptional accessory protein [Leeia sp. TBRC 13508]|uniref:RNA-binding transcriptional accessory protein n=1 Tax=Leeia speluncae TaxID=2884804 RepID=A0ABS8D2P0_9NEIS|nr:Tex family protein [Leeia speluncae]MCB6182454.1 RNA-binding transcriptional accessory protein [Leeia speluncae]